MIILMNLYLVLGAITGTLELIGECMDGVEPGYLFRALLTTVLWPIFISGFIEGFIIAMHEYKNKDK